jgi:arylsulfatase A-like enzyme
MRLALLLIAVLACTRAPAPPTATRLIHELPLALNVPPPPPQQILLQLAEVPRAQRIVIPFRPRPKWPFVVRLQLRRTDGRFPEVSLRALNESQAAALGDAPQALAGPVPGSEIGPCFPGPEKGDWISCQRFATLQPNDKAAALVIDGEGVRDVQAFAAEVSPPLAPQSPLLHPLLVQDRKLTGHSISSRDALVAFGGETTYAFPVTLPEGAELRVGLGLSSRIPLEPARFTIRLDGQTLFDEVLEQEGWRDVTVPLPGAAGRVTRLELTARPASGAVTHALWANPRVAGKSQRPSIVVISIDALRADHLGFNGYSRDTSPTLDKLAQAGVVFERATAQAPRTWQSVISFLSGRYPTRAGVRTQGAAPPPEVPLLPELLAPFGYESVAGSDLASFPPLIIDRFDEERIVVPGEPRGVGLQEQLGQIAKEIARRPTFAWFHLENPHYPLRPREPLRYDPGYSGRFQQTFLIEDRLANPLSSQLTGRELFHLRALYDACIRDADAMVLTLIQALIANGASENTILVVTADHGDLIDEHGITLEHQTQFEGVLHVPLLFVWPRELTARRIPQRVQLVDLVPTLFSLAGLPKPQGLDGRDLSPLLRGGTLPEADAFSEVTEQSRVVYRHDQKLIASAPGVRITLLGIDVPLPQQALFDLASDPAEAHPLATPLAAELRAVLDAEVTRERADQPREGVPVIGQAAQQAMLNAGYLARPAKP